MKPSPPRCGLCNSPNTDAVFADLGDGVRQVSGAVCLDCRAVEILPRERTPEKASSWKAAIRRRL